MHGWKPVGLLSELIVVINDNNDNAVHVYRTKSWTVLVVTVTAKIVTIKCLIVLSLFIFIFYKSWHDNSTGYTIAV